MKIAVLAPTEPFRARAALATILDDYDYWDGYVGWYSSLVKVIAVLCAVGFTAGLALSVELFLLGGHGLWGPLAAGAAGAFLSILLKLPPLSVYGESSWLIIRATGRLLAGIAATAIGFGLLSSGVIGVGLGTNLSMSDLVNINGNCPAISEQERRTMVEARSDQNCAARREATCTEVCYGVGELCMREKPGDAAGKCKRCIPATVGQILLLLTLGLLLGFSERALTSFDSLVTARLFATNPLPPARPGGGPKGNDAPPPPAPEPQKDKPQGA